MREADQFGLHSVIRWGHLYNAAWSLQPPNGGIYKKAMILRDDGLLEDLYGGMHQQPLWEKFLHNLQVQARAKFVSLTLRTIDQDIVVQRYAGAESSKHLHGLFIEKHAWGLFAARHVREGRVYSMEDLVDPRDPVHRPLIDELITLPDLNNLRSVRVSEPSGIEALLSCVGGREIGAGTGALLNTLTPHLRLAMRALVAVERERYRSSVTSDALGRLSFGWLALDAHCRVVDATPHAKGFLERGRYLRLGHHGRLTLATPALDRELAAHIKSFAEQRDTRPQALPLSRDPYVDMLITPAPSQVIARSLPVALAYISGDQRPVTDCHEQLGQLFGLLPSHAKLAWAIARGATIAEAARQLNLSLETARSYSKKIYAKTGARGQPDLVRIISTSILGTL
jgi:hypothetical protein